MCVRERARACMRVCDTYQCARRSGARPSSSERRPWQRQTATYKADIQGRHMQHRYQVQPSIGQRVCMPYMNALYECLIYMPYMYALYVCHVRQVPNAASDRATRGAGSGCGQLCSAGQCIQDRHIRRTYKADIQGRHIRNRTPRGASIRYVRQTYKAYI